MQPRKKYKVFQGIKFGKATGYAPTDLAKWLEWKMYTRLEAAQKLDITRGYLAKLIRAKCTPSKQLAEYIEYATEGKVKAEAWPATCSQCNQPLPK